MIAEAFRSLQKPSTACRSLQQLGLVERHGHGGILVWLLEQEAIGIQHGYGL